MESTARKREARIVADMSPHRQNVTATHLRLVAQVFSFIADPAVADSYYVTPPVRLAAQFRFRRFGRALASSFIPVVDRVVFPGAWPA